MSSLKADETFYSLALINTPGIGHATAKFVLSHFPDLSEVFCASKKNLSKIPGIGEKAISGIRKKDGLSTAEKILSDSRKKEIDIIPFHSDNYPHKLRQIIDAPFVLYYRGNLDLGYQKSLGIVGTRDASHYGKIITQQIITDMVSQNPVIISGLAYGIDIEAHKTSLSEGLNTIAVLAGGLDRVYPSIHQKTADRMLDQGGLISEQPPGTKSDAHLFPARNRIISGLADALVVVEAKEKGGALITAALSDSYNRPVFAVPGNLNQQTSTGCNKLIRDQKALIYTGAKDFSYQLNWDDANDKVVPLKNLHELSPDESKVYGLLLDHLTGISIDDLAWKSKIQINLLSSILLSLEFKGLAKPLPGKKYLGTN